MNTPKNNIIAQFSSRLNPYFKKYLAVVEKSQGEFSQYLPDVRNEKRKEVRLIAQSELQTNVEAVIKSIQDDIKKSDAQIFEKKYPKRSKGYLTDDLSAAGDRQLNAVLNLLSYQRTQEQILFHLKHFIDCKQYDAAFLLYDNIMMTFNPYKDDVKKKEMINNIEEVISNLKNELGITEIENKIKLYNQFLSNAKPFLTVLKAKFDLGDSHVRELHQSVKTFMRDVFPDLYDYIFKKSYPAQA